MSNFPGGGLVPGRLGVRDAQAPLGELRFGAQRDPEYTYEEKDASQVSHLLQNFVTNNIEAWTTQTSFIIVRTYLPRYRIVA